MIKRIVALVLAIAALVPAASAADPVVTAVSGEALNRLPGGQLCTQVVLGDVTETVCIPTP